MFHQKHRLLSLVAVLVLTLILTPLSQASAGAPPQPEAIRPGPLEGLPPGLAGALARALADELPASYSVTSADAGYRATNPAQGLQFTFTPGGVEVRDQAEGWSWRLALTGAGYGSDIVPLPPARLVADGPSLAYHRGDPARGEAIALTEWYLNTTWGLEQGFTLEAPPAPAGEQRGGGLLTLQLALTGDLAVSLEGGALLFRDGSGQVVVQYAGLHAYDARGQSLPATLALSPGANTLAIQVDDSAAAYPITIDPWIQKARLTASDGAGRDQFGFSVAVNGDTVVVGAHEDGDMGSMAGAAFVFVKPLGGWSPTATSGRVGTAPLQEAAKLLASDGAVDAELGMSVDISGDTVVVGAPYAENKRGAAYIYQKPAGGWAAAPRPLTETAKLVAGARSAEDYFGMSVAIDGDTVVVGANGVNQFRGAAYVYQKPAGGWSPAIARGQDSSAGPMTEDRMLVASDGGPSQHFGAKVDISGDTVLAGSSWAENATGTAYLFVKPPGGWSSTAAPLVETARLRASDAAFGESFAESLAISGDTAVVGAYTADGTQGAVYLYVKPAGGWTPTAARGRASTAPPLAPSAPTPILTETRKLLASDGANGAWLGFSVDINGETVMTGAPNAGQSGAVYLFTRPAAGWAGTGTLNETRKLLASDVTDWGDVGFAVAVDGGTVVASEPYLDMSRGAAYVFVKPGASWAGAAPLNETRKLLASDGGHGDDLGHSVALDGDTVVVGAPTHNWERGAAYVFVRPPAGWAGPLSEAAKLTASDAKTMDAFGTAVAIQGDTVVVGSPYAGNKGAAYVYVQPAGGWTSAARVGAARSAAPVTEDAKLVASDGANAHEFGAAVDVAGDTVVAGAPSVQNYTGAVYLFRKPAGGWSSSVSPLKETRILKASDAAEADQLGWSVAASGDVVVAGAKQTDDDRGSVYLWVKPGAGWVSAGGQALEAPLTETRQLEASDRAVDDEFGYSVAMDGDVVVAGAPDHNGSRGAAYLYQKPAGGWAGAGPLLETRKLVASTPEESDNLGHSVAISGDTVAAAVPGDGEGLGAVFVYGKPAGGWASGAAPLSEEDSLVASDGDTPAHFSAAVAASGSTVVAGAPYANTRKGAAYVFVASTGIVVEKQTEPDGATQAFTFSGDLSGTLKDGQTLVMEAGPGTYLVTETVPDGWELASIECDDDNSSGAVSVASAVYRVSQDETVKCTFTNRRLGSIVVAKETVPAGAGTRFTFSGDASGSIAGGEKIVVAGLAPGTYTAQETVPPPWSLSSVVCDDGDSTGDVASRKATFRLQAGETVTCTFTNQGPAGVYLPLVLYKNR